MIRKTFLLIAALMLVLVGCSSGGSGGSSSSGGSGGGSGKSDQTYEIKFGSAIGENSSFWQAFLHFKETVETKSDGRLKVTIYGNASLGADREMIESLQLGNLEMAHVSNTPLSNFEQNAMFFELPYLVNTHEDMWEFLNGPVIEELNNRLIAKDIRPIGWSAIEFNIITNNVRPVRTPDDVKGLIIRSPENNFMPEYYRALGASPVPIPFPEIYSALQQGLIEGHHTGAENNLTLSLHEQAKYATLTNHFATVAPYLISEKFFQSLPEDLQQIILDAGQEVAELTQQITVDAEKRGYEKLREYGMEFIELTPDELQLFIEAGKPVYEKAKGVLDAEFFELLDKELGLSSR